jgi:hypothetical protein
VRAPWLAYVHDRKLSDDAPSARRRPVRPDAAFGHHGFADQPPLWPSASRGRRDGAGGLSARTVRYFHTVTQTIDAGVKRALGSAPEQAAHTARDDDPAIRKFWKTVLSPSIRVKARQRLKVLKALDEMGVLPRCKCDRAVEQLPEFKQDQFRAYVIRRIGQRHYRAALMIAPFPETYYAVRDAIDAKIRLDGAEAAEETDPEVM